MEIILQKECGDLEDVQQMDVVAYLNENFGTVDTLENIDSMVGSLDKQIKGVDEQLRDIIRDQAYAAENARMQLNTINERSVQMIDKITSVKKTAGDSEAIVQEGCKEIRQLDLAKKNITFSITSLKRLIMLI